MAKPTAPARKPATIPGNRQAKESTALATTTKPNLTGITKAEPIPDYLKQFKGHETGLEGADQSDFIIPRLALAQKQSPQTTEGDPKYIEGLKVGDFFNTVTNENYGPVVDFIPLFQAKNRILFKKPIGSGIECSSQVDKETNQQFGRLSILDAGGCLACSKSQFKDVPDANGSTAPDCTEFKGFVSLVNGQPIGISLKSTSLGEMKSMNSKIRLSGLPAYCLVFRATNKATTKNGNTFRQWILERIAFTPQEFVEAAAEYFNNLRERGVKIDTEGEGDETFDTETM